MIKEKHINIKSIIFIGLTLAVMITIFIFSSKNSDDSTEQSNFISKIILYIFSNKYRNGDYVTQQKMLIDITFFVRKTAHFSIYSALGLFSFFSVYFSSNLKLKSSFISFPFCVIYAISDEIHQLFSSGRSCQFRDVIIDSSGAALVMLVVTAILIIFSKKRQKSNS